MEHRLSSVHVLGRVLLLHPALGSTFGSGEPLWFQDEQVAEAFEQFEQPLFPFAPALPR